MSIEQDILEFLSKYIPRTIPLSSLEKQVKGHIDYHTFAITIHRLTEKDILLPIKSHGTNGKPLPLFNTYRVRRVNLRESLNREIQNYSLTVNPEINLDIYFSLEKNEWRNDLPYIDKINTYLLKNALPLGKATIPERSFHLVGDEKWIDEKGGRRIIERLGLWDKLNLITNPDPLMIAVNPVTYYHSAHLHLIVENKATYFALVEFMRETNFTSLTFGSGWKIVSNLGELPKQLGLEKDLHRIYYFGDLDLEGIAIWYSLYEKHQIELAIPFYRALLQKSYAIGKETQLLNIEAVEKFKTFFDEEEKAILAELIHEKGYLPQEGLSKQELGEIWRQDWWIYP